MYVKHCKHYNFYMFILSYHWIHMQLHSETMSVYRLYFKCEQKLCDGSAESEGGEGRKRKCNWVKSVLEKVIRDNKVWGVG